MIEILSKAKFRYIDSSKYDTDWHSTLHSHAFTELFYVEKGKGKFKFGENEYLEVNEDDMVIINSNIMHTEISDPDYPLEYTVIGIEGLEFLTDEKQGYSIHNYYHHKTEILFYMRSIFEEVRKKDMFNEQMINHLLQILIMNIIRRTESELSISKEDPNINKDCVFIENYISNHYKENITLDKLSDLTFLNKYYLSHEFKKYSGKSPIDFLLTKRLNEAKKLLSTTDLSIAQISNIVGFGNSSYFSQYFKKTLGQSPSEYRNNYEHNES